MAIIKDDIKDDIALLEYFDEIVKKAIKRREKNSLGPGLGSKYPKMGNARNYKVIKPALYFETKSGRLIPQVSRMELPMQAFGLIGMPDEFRDEILFGNLDDVCSSDKEEAEASGDYNSYPTRREYLNYRRDELCIRISDILQKHQRGEVIWEEMMVDVVNANILDELRQVAQKAKWGDKTSRERFLNWMLLYHDSLEKVAKLRGELELFYFDSPREGTTNPWARRERYIKRIWHLVKQIEDN